MHKDFADPLYGFVRAYNHELDLIDSRIFQRLRYIRQLGIAYLVFPTAHHTRFDHSLGVMELSGRIYKALGLKDERDHQIVRLAGLLHDIGHPPFSHTTEVLLGDRSHEEVGEQVVKDGQVGELLTKCGFSLDEVELIARIAFKRPENEYERLLSSVITGEFGSDRIDYIRRDAYFCGTSYGFFDVDRLLNHMQIVEDKKVISVSALRALESFFLGRYFMYVQVYFHKVVRILSIHLLELVEEVFGENYFKDINLYLSFTDSSVLAEIFRCFDNLKVKRVFGREHFREVFSSENTEVFKDIKALALTKFDADKLRFDVCRKKIIDEDVYVLKNENLFPVREVSPILKDTGEIVICRIYADRSIEREVREWLSSLRV